MSLLKIYTYPDEILRKKCDEVKEITDAEKILIANMIETMFAAKGVGLAASQVGVLKKIIICSPKASRDEVFVFINPIIVEKSGCQLGEEGCLSVPNAEGEIERAKRIKVEALDEEGRKITFVAEDFFARIIQHEMDHLDGILFIEHLGFTARNEAIKATLGNS